MTLLLQLCHSVDLGYPSMYTRVSFMEHGKLELIAGHVTIVTVVTMTEWLLLSSQSDQQG